jgi:hypothetical protein
VKADIRVAHVIPDDEKDVRFALRESKGGKGEEAEDFFHEMSEAAPKRTGCAKTFFLLHGLGWETSTLPYL